MNIRFSFPVTMFHRHDDLVLGPDSRPHSHDLVVTLFIGGLGFDPITGGLVDPKVGLVSLGDTQARMLRMAGAYGGKDISEIHGIKPTFASLALSIKERYLLSWPEVEVHIRCEDEGWEIET
jgi:hypothetical protein